MLGDVQKRKSRRKAEKLVMIGVNLEVSPKASPLFQNCLAQPTPNVVSMTHSAARPGRSRQNRNQEIRLRVWVIQCTVSVGLSVGLAESKG